jgi:hypothetical protein
MKARTVRWGKIGFEIKDQGIPGDALKFITVT